MTTAGFFAWLSYCLRRPRLYVSLEVVAVSGQAAPQLNDQHMWTVMEGDDLMLEVTRTGAPVWPVASVAGHDLPGSHWTTLHDGVVSVWHVRIPCPTAGVLPVVVWFVPVWGRARAEEIQVQVLSAPVQALTIEPLEFGPLLFRVRVGGEVRVAGTYMLVLFGRTSNGALLEWARRIELIEGMWSSVYAAENSDPVFAERGVVTFEKAALFAPDTLAEYRFGESEAFTFGQLVQEPRVLDLPVANSQEASHPPVEVPPAPRTSAVPAPVVNTAPDEPAQLESAPVVSTPPASEPASVQIELEPVESDPVEAGSAESDVLESEPLPPAPMVSDPAAPVLVEGDVLNPEQVAAVVPEVAEPARAEANVPEPERPFELDF